MSSNGRLEFDVRQSTRATEQLKKLAKLAIDKGIKGAMVDALKSIVAKLQSNPIKTGDPEHRLQKPGGMMYHAVFGPLFV